MDLLEIQDDMNFTQDIMAIPASCSNENSMTQFLPSAYFAFTHNVPHINLGGVMSDDFNDRKHNYKCTSSIIGHPTFQFTCNGVSERAFPD
jgi:hypothetical protein